MPSSIMPHGAKWLSIGAVAGLWLNGCGARSSLHDGDGGAPASTSSSEGGAPTTSDTGGAPTTSDTGGAPTTSTTGDPAKPCALPSSMTATWSIPLDALGLSATDMAVEPGDDIYVGGPGPFVARFSPQGDLQWVAGQPSPAAGGVRVFPGPNDRLGLLTESGARHYALQGTTLSLLGELPADDGIFYPSMALGPAGRVYLTQGWGSDVVLLAMDEAMNPLWAVDGTFATPIGHLVKADIGGRVVHAGGYKPESGYTTFGWLDSDGTSVFSTIYPETWAGMMDLAISADGSAFVAGNGNAGQAGWLERFTPEGVLASYAETGIGNGGDALVSCGLAVLPSGEAWTCGNLDFQGTLLAHFSAEGELIKVIQVPVDTKCGGFFFRKIDADSMGRVIALHAPETLSLLLLP